MEKLFILFLVMFSLPTFGAVTGTFAGKILGVRVEGATGLISLPQNIVDGDYVCSRVWLDLTKDYDRVAYSTFLMAFSADKTVHIRAISEGALRLGACNFYDVYIAR